MLPRKVLATSQTMSCRQNFHENSEAALNKQINMELTASYVYMSMATFFARESVALPGLQEFFAKASTEEREHAQKLIDYITKRGGKVQFSNIIAPKTEWDSPLAALEAALALEQRVNQSLLDLHAVADEHNDPHLGDFIEEEFLGEQVDGAFELAQMITKLKRAQSDELGLYLFDKSM